MHLGGLISRTPRRTVVVEPELVLLRQNRRAESVSVRLGLRQVHVHVVNKASWLPAAPSIREAPATWRPTCVRACGDFMEAETRSGHGVPRAPSALVPLSCDVGSSAV